MIHIFEWHPVVGWTVDEASYDRGAFISKHQSLFLYCLHFEDEGAKIVRNVENDSACL